ncbi:MAG TPA: bacillithiol transferase BstA [Thermoanaerobaculia bacterium]
MTDPRYPVGPFIRRDQLSAEERRTMIDAIAATPQRLAAAIEGMTEEQLDTPYRDGGWTVRQVVHHLADSHMNAYMRLKLALTEEEPVLRPYDEAAWAELEDARTMEPDVSVTLLRAIHLRFVSSLRSMDERDFARTLRHPEHAGVLTIDWLVAMYSWHGRHHVAHITTLRERMKR